MNKPRFKSKTFDRLCIDLVVGSATTKTQYSIVIPSYMDTSDGDYKEGELQGDRINLLREYLSESDLNIIRNLTATKPAIVYVLFHTSTRGTGKIIVHGTIVTDVNNNTLHRFYLGKTYKSNQIINATSSWLSRRNSAIQESED